MTLNALGQIAEQEWFKTPSIRPDMNIQLEAFVVMPNHIHGIIHIGQNQYNSPDVILDGKLDGKHPVSTTIHTPTSNQFITQSKNLSAILRGYKSAVTRQARQTIPEFGWQERFHDHINRTTESFERIQDYIINNPKEWREDKFY